jgi:hypothetical protein
MARIRVHTDIQATPAQVWDAIADVGSHVLWMHDAHAIRFTSSRQQGVGTTFECDTRIGPLQLIDDMEITRWRPRRQMGVRHRGVVSGKGMFTLKRRRGGRGQAPVTRFTWTERLHLPWYLGGPFGALAAAPLLRWIWRRNLRSLRRLVEAGRL